MTRYPRTGVLAPSAVAVVDAMTTGAAGPEVDDTVFFRTLLRSGPMHRPGVIFPPTLSKAPDFLKTARAPGG